MKQLLILSGKGGTGKTTVASALITLSKCQAYADCDVDAPNLHLVTAQKGHSIQTDYFGFKKAVIDSEKCLQCGMCEKYCRFEAINDYSVGLFECEGCGVCEAICPSGAVQLQDYASGSLMLYKKEEQVFSTAQLKMGSGASGKLVTAVKKALVKEASNEAWAVIDGSPGIGCPVIASISGVSLVLVVAEPTLSGIHDMKRILETAERFGVPCIVCINKYDVNLTHTKTIETYCRQMGIAMIGKIPFDKTVIEAVNQCKSIVNYPESKAAKAIETLWKALQVL